MLPIDHHSSTEKETKSKALVHQHKSVSHSLTPSKMTILLPGNHTDATNASLRRRGQTTDNPIKYTMSLVMKLIIGNKGGQWPQRNFLDWQHQQQKYMIIIAGEC